MVEEKTIDEKILLLDQILLDKLFLIKPEYLIEIRVVKMVNG
jgi:hypothetical protein